MNPINSKHTSITPPTDDEGKQHYQHRSKRGGCKYPFPERLFDLLEEIDLRKPELSCIISWHPNGKSFQLFNHKAFEKVIQRKYFNQSKYASFRRQLNLWGFERLPDQQAAKEREDSGGCYFHPLFQRCNRSLCCTMSRVVGRDGSKKLRSVSISSNGDNDDAPNAMNFNSEEQYGSCSVALFSSSPFPSLVSSSSLLEDYLEDPLEPIVLPEMISSIGIRDARENEAMGIGDESLEIEDPRLQQEAEQGAISTTQNNAKPASFSCRTANDYQFELLINFLSANDDNISKYLFES